MYRKLFLDLYRDTFDRTIQQTSFCLLLHSPSFSTLFTNWNKLV